MDYSYCFTCRATGPCVKAKLDFEVWWSDIWPIMINCIGTSNSVSASSALRLQLSEAGAANNIWSTRVALARMHWWMCRNLYLYKKMAPQWAPHRTSDHPSLSSHGVTLSYLTAKWKNIFNGLPFSHIFFKEELAKKNVNQTLFLMELFSFNEIKYFSK